jgi:O-antigen ligase
LGLTGAIFFTIFAVGCVLALVRHPIYGAIAYVSVFFFNPTSHWWGQGLFASVRWALVSAAVTLIGVALHNREPGVRRPEGSVFRSGATRLLIAFTIWLGIQSLWALDPNAHIDLFSYYMKFLLALVLLYKSIDSDRNLRLVLWAYVCGCLYFGVVAFTSYTGGRFEDFGGSVGEANAAALTIVVGIFFASSLLITGSPLQKAVILCMIPVIVNALVATISRSGFLALVAGGIVYNLFTPARLRRSVRVLSVLAAALLLMLSGPSYWQRMHSIEYAGADVAGVDTGGGRMELIQAQWRMFREHPLGCGAMCTATLSPGYLSDRFLATTAEGARVRASHNTFMSMLVEHGIPGAALYVALWLWTIKNLITLARAYRAQPDAASASLLPAIAAAAGSILVADQFVSYLKFEVRIWIIALIMVMLDLVAQRMRQPVTRAAATRSAAGLERPPPRLPARV